MRAYWWRPGIGGLLAPKAAAEAEPFRAKGDVHGGGDPKRRYGVFQGAR